MIEKQSDLQVKPQIMNENLMNTEAMSAWKVNRKLSTWTKIRKYSEEVQIEE